MKAVIHPTSSLVPELSKHVFTAGVLAGTCYASLRNLLTVPLTQPLEKAAAPVGQATVVVPAPERPKAMAAAA